MPDRIDSLMPDLHFYDQKEVRFEPASIFNSTSIVFIVSVVLIMFAT